MKVGTDGVLLGAWVVERPAGRILDIGTGTGLIALMLAQRFPGVIDAIELDPDACRQARANVMASKWADRIHVIHDSIQHYSGKRTQGYDLIVSNPPFYLDAFHTPSPARNIARHTNSGLPFTDLADGVCRLLTPRGRFDLILPAREGRLFLEIADRRGLHLRRLTRVRTKQGGIEKRWLMEMGFERGDVAETEMSVRDGEGRFSPEYIRMTFAYYLGLERGLTEGSRHRRTETADL
jgi:tRNA1Val (adenine37-N6)-methyltransferase